jgi:trimethylguanosine synthase
MENTNCFCDTNKKVVKFIPEIEPEEITVTKNIFNYKFPKFNSKIDFTKLRMSNIGMYSIAKPNMAQNICKYIEKYIKTRNITITDALGNMGGMTLIFAHTFDVVNVCEIITLHCDILKNNLKVYNLIDKVNVVCGDYYEQMFKFKQDVIFFDPPWGGPSYGEQKELQLCINNVNITCIIIKLLKNAKYIFLLVPSNYDFNNFLKHISKENIKINIHSLCDKLDGNSKLLIVIKSLYFQ